MYTDLPTPMNVKFNRIPPKTIPGELTITWELVFEGTPNATHDQGYNVLLNTSNCGTCLTIITLSNFTMCNLTEDNVQLDINCTVLVIVEDSMECDITKSTTAELNLSGE